jgi:prepilin-type N-terminal cleavage/methylation domain-containing protein
MRTPSKGFSLIELIIVMAILLVVSGAVFRLVAVATERSSTEQTKLDMFQEAREFMDQMSRDLRGAGYPNPRNVTSSVLTQVPEKNDRHAAVGLVKVEAGDLWFEGDVDGTGTVSTIKYHLDTSTSNHCPCLKRSQLPKVDGDPLAEGTGGQTPASYEIEVQGVTNTAIFSAYNNGAVVGLPVTLSTAAGDTLAGVDTIQAVLSLQASVADPQTHQKPTTTILTTLKLNNCSQAAPGQQTSCQ